MIERLMSDRFNITQVNNFVLFQILIDSFIKNQNLLC